MKSFDEIRQIGKLIVLQEGEDGGRGWLTGIDPRKPAAMMKVIWSNGGGWDHVSVSWEKRDPTWAEMCEVKRLFFHPEECCVEYHPPESMYVNIHPHCLHIWRRQCEEGMPMPPIEYV